MQRASAMSKAISPPPPVLSSSGPLIQACAPSLSLPPPSLSPLCDLVMGCECPACQEESAHTGILTLPVTSPLPPQNSSAPEKCHHANAPPTCLSFIFDCVSRRNPLSLESWHRNTLPPHPHLHSGPGYQRPKGLFPCSPVLYPVWTQVFTTTALPGSLCNQVGPPQHPSHERV